MAKSLNEMRSTNPLKVGDIYKALNEAKESEGGSHGRKIKNWVCKPAPEAYVDKGPGDDLATESRTRKVKKECGDVSARASKIKEALRALRSKKKECGRNGCCEKKKEQRLCPDCERKAKMESRICPDCARKAKMESRKNSISSEKKMRRDILEANRRSIREFKQKKMDEKRRIERIHENRKRILENCKRREEEERLDEARKSRKEALKKKVACGIVRKVKGKLVPEVKSRRPKVKKVSEAKKTFLDEKIKAMKEGLNSPSDIKKRIEKIRAKYEARIKSAAKQERSEKVDEARSALRSKISQKNK